MIWKVPFIQSEIVAFADLVVSSSGSPRASSALSDLVPPSHPFTQFQNICINFGNHLRPCCRFGWSSTQSGRLSTTGIRLLGLTSWAIWQCHTARTWKSQLVPRLLVHSGYVHSLGIPSIGHLLNMLVVRSLFSLMGIELLGVAVGEAANRRLWLLMHPPFAELGIFHPARVTVPRGKIISLFRL